MSVLRRALRRTPPAGEARPEPPDDCVAVLHALSEADRTIVEAALPYTMTGPARLAALIEAVRYLEARRIPGAFAECGVWRGGSIRAMIDTLQTLGAPPRDLYLYDTFSGMTEPTELDTSDFEPPALETWREAQAKGERAYDHFFNEEVFSESMVHEMLLGTGYPDAHLHLVAGKVEDTLPARAPDGPIALLRLDTDWYESTRHELEHLYPRISPGGVLIIDDYGHFAGARQAVDEYLGEHGALLLNRVDYSARIAVKA